MQRTKHNSASVDSHISGVKVQILTGLARLEPSTYRLGGDVSVYTYQGF
jgi:hypothetical protein